jgi:hypothetical protein
VRPFCPLRNTFLTTSNPLTGSRLGMNPLRIHASTRTKEDIKSIRHVYLDLDHGGQEALNSVENSSAVPKPNYVLTSSPGKFQIVWKVEGMGLCEAEGLLRAMARECGGDPAATDATRVLGPPGFANKKYEANFFVAVRKVSERIYRLRDFKLNIDSQDSPSYNDHERAKRASSSRADLSQSEHDWAFAKRALARGEPLERGIRPIAQYRAAFKSNPLHYARYTVMKVAKLFDSRPNEPGGSLQRPASWSQAARLEEGVPGISKGSGKGYRRSVRRRNLANGERLSQRETHAGDYRCRRKLAGASRVSLLTRMCSSRAYRASESPLYSVVIQVRPASQVGANEQFHLASKRRHSG